MNEEKPLKKSYFAKKRHFYLFYHIDYQCSNNFKKKREGIWAGADSIFVVNPNYQVSFLAYIKSL